MSDSLIKLMKEFNPAESKCDPITYLSRKLNLPVNETLQKFLATAETLGGFMGLSGEMLLQVPITHRLGKEDIQRIKRAFKLTKGLWVGQGIAKALLDQSPNFWASRYILEVGSSLSLTQLREHVIADYRSLGKVKFDYTAQPSSNSRRILRLTIQDNIFNIFTFVEDLKVIAICMDFDLSTQFMEGKARLPIVVECEI